MSLIWSYLLELVNSNNKSIRQFRLVANGPISLPNSNSLTLLIGPKVCSINKQDWGQTFYEDGSYLVSSLVRATRVKQ